MPRETGLGITADELDAFLRAHEEMVLATVDPDGGTWADVLPYRFDGERVAFDVAERTRSFRNLRADSRVCCLVEHRPVLPDPGIISLGHGGFEVRLYQPRYSK